MGERGDDNTGKLDLRGLTTIDYMHAEAKLSVEQKSAFATQLAISLNANAGTADDFANAEAILRMMVWNAEPQVIEAMAHAAAANPNTPRSLAWALANDDEAAATPILAVSGALSDEDLLAILEETKSYFKMTAIAQRPTVSEDVSRSLSQRGDEATLQALLSNDRAKISDDAYGSMLDRFGADEGIKKGIAKRDEVSPAVAERVRKNTGAGPSALPGFPDEQTTAERDRRLAQLLAQRGLNEAFLVRQLCLGEFQFFCAALCAKANAPEECVPARIIETPHLAELWQKAALARDWLPVVNATLAALVQIDRDYAKSDRQLFSRNVVTRAQANLKAEKVVLTEAQRRFFARPGI